MFPGFSAVAREKRNRAPAVRWSNGTANKLGGKEPATSICRDGYGVATCDNCFTSFPPE